MTIWCTYSSWICYFGNLSPMWGSVVSETIYKKMTSILHTKTPSKHQMKQHRKRHHVPVLSLIGLVDFLILWRFFLLLALLPPHIFALGFIQPLSRSTEQGSVCVVCPLVCLRALAKKEVVGVRPESGSHLCLQVHDLLAHQRNGGTGLLPLHRLQLQRGGRHCLQVLPHPRWGGVGLPYALPRPLTRCLLFILMGRGQRKKACFLR